MEKQKEVLVSKSAKEFILGNKLDLVPTVRTNENGYPFITFVDKANVANNIYFGKTCAEEFPEGTDIKPGFFNDIQFVLVTYEDDREPQWKMTNNKGPRVTGESMFA